MHDDIRLSIVLPIYNASSTILPCMLSALVQLPQCAELICIDDGSTDDSLEQARRIAVDFPDRTRRVRFFSQSNKGLSVARNFGVAKARGAHVGFLDADDMLATHYFARVLDVLDARPDVSIICFNARIFEQTSESGASETHLATHATQGAYRVASRRGARLLARDFACTAWFAWARVYDKKLFDTLSFKPGLEYQDMHLLPDIYRRAKWVVNIPDALVRYRKHGASISSARSRKSVCHLDQILARYRTSSRDLSAGLDRLRYLVLLSALESIWQVVLHLEGRTAARQALVLRRQHLPCLQIRRAALRYRSRRPALALLHFSPLIHHYAYIGTRYLTR